MINAEKYETPEDRYNAFQKYCAKHNGCKNCPLSENISCECTFSWLDLEVEEDEEEEKHN